MPTVGPFSAWIMCNGRPLPEYCVQVLDINTLKVSCWIPSEADKNFSVFWRDGGSCLHSCGFISLDGFVVPGRFLCGYGVTSRDGVRTSNNTERPFTFAQQTITSTSEGQVHPDAGTIKLKIRWINIEGSRTPNTLQQLPEPSRLQGSTLSHCTSFGEQKPTYEQYHETWNVKPGQSGNRSDVTFEFHYRPREFLLSKGIMPLEDTIPPAVRRACIVNRRVASSPLPASSSSMTSVSDCVNNNSEQMDSTPDAAVDPATLLTSNPRAVSASHNRRDRYPGEGVLDLRLDPNVWQT